MILKSAMSLLFSAVAIASIGTGVAPHISKDAFIVTLSERQPPPDINPPSLTEQTATEDPPTEPDGYEIVPVNISHADGSGSILFKNDTKYTFDTDELLSADISAEKAPDGMPIVLIVHTHATECYTEEDALTVCSTRSTDPEKNMLAIGEVICEKMNENGVAAIQCRTAHDESSYNQAYKNCENSVCEYLEKYPSIKYVIDVHRDAIELADGGMAKPVTTDDKKETIAQLMLVVGTDEAGADHPNWTKNLALAVKLQKKLIEQNEELMRPINLRSASFNQQYCEGALLLEVGSCANTLKEAKAAAEVFACVFSEMIKDTCK